MTSVDLEKTKLTESPTTLIALIPMALAAVPDFVLSVVTVVMYVPEHVWEQFFEEWVNSITCNRDDEKNEI